MKRFWEPGMGRTILFSLAVVTFVIGAYQTSVENNPAKPMESLQRNYWLFMISLGCTMFYRYLKQREKEKEAAKPVAKPSAAGKSMLKPGPRKKGRA